MLNKRTLMFIALGLIVIGIAGAGNVILHGEHAMGTSNGIPWGSLIAGYEYFIGISTGLVLVASLGYVFNFKAFLAIGKNAVMLALFTILSAFAILAIELGNVLHMFYYFISPNFSSPIWWMAPLYSIYLITLIALLYNIVKNNKKNIKIFATLAFISAIVALGNIGFLFGLIQARPYWQGPLSPLYFVVSAFFSGVAVLSFINYYFEKENKLDESMSPVLKKLLILSILAMAFMYINKIITGLYGAASGKYEAVYALLSGPLSFNFIIFEILLGMVIPLALIWKGTNSKNIALAGLIATIGIFFMRLDMVIAGQIVPLKVVYGGAKELVYHSYTLTWAEWAIIIGAIGISLLLYVVRNSLEVKVKTYTSGKSLSQ